MHRRRVLSLPLLAGASLSGAGCAQPRRELPRTSWLVRTSEGLDALAFLGPLSGRPFYARYYERELAEFKPQLPPSALQALDVLHADADTAGSLLWPQLALIFSGARDDTLADLLNHLDSAEATLRPAFASSVYWDADGWARFMRARPRLRVVLEALRDAGFGEFAAAQIATQGPRRRDELQRLFAGLDVVGEQERLLGRRLEPRVEIDLLWFCRPHGVKVQGQRFLAHVSASDAILVLTAAHELLHPPFDLKGATGQACLAVLGDDPLLARILGEKDKATGYNTLEGILDEDTVQALDQIVQERLGYGEPAAHRWGTRDQGMHVLAAGLYGLLKADGYDRRGGAIEEWMAAAVAQGRLAPMRWQAAAAAVLGRPVDRLWVTPA